MRITIFFAFSASPFIPSQNSTTDFPSLPSQVIRSPVSTAFKLHISLLERLMSHPDYSPSNAEKRGVTYSLLTRNFRNHPSILRIPNALFYGNELEPCASRSTVGRLERWSGWPGPEGGRFPVFFHAVKGRDEREGRNPSFFNIAEITCVKMYVDYLQNRRSGVQLRTARSVRLFLSIFLPSYLSSLRFRPFHRRHLSIQCAGEEAQGGAEETGDDDRVDGNVPRFGAAVRPPSPASTPLLFSHSFY